MRNRFILASMGGLLLASGASAIAAPAASKIVLTLKDHRFSADVLSAPAGQTVEITLVNEDPTIEEFDSDDLGVEETVHPHETIRFDIGPLKPGSYNFMGEFHPATAHGQVTVAPAA